MNEIAASESALARSSFGLAARLAVLAGLFVLEKLILNGFVDFSRAQTAEGLGAWVRDVQHFGFRFLVAFAAALALFAYVRGGPALQAADAAMRRARLRLRWLLAHGVLFACLVPLSYLLYRGSGVPLSLLVGLWLLIGAAAALCALASLAPRPLWWGAGAALGSLWAYAAIAALAGAGVMQWSQRLWAPTATLTFDLVRALLLPLLPTLTADPATRVLSTDHFAVEVSDTCSGLEGMGLMLAFSAAWLVYFRREYIFPRALLLIPVGIAGMFALNVLRIAALLLIGHAGFPDVAQYGFHSQAGWIAFNTAACLLVFASRRSGWLNRDVAAHEKPAARNPTAPYLMPLLAILASGALARAASPGFETLYPLRLLAAAAVLWAYRRPIAAMDWRFSWRGPAVGVIVFVIWLAAAHVLLPVAPMPRALSALPPTSRAFWTAARIAAAVITVPLAEELAYRGYLMRRLTTRDFDEVPYGAVHWPALSLAALVFGLSHGPLWLPGIAAGLSFGLLAVRRGGLGEAVAAHAVANALIAVSVLKWAQWQLW